MLKIIQKEISLLDGIKISIDIRIPLGDDVDIVEDDSFMEEILVNQVLRGLRRAIDDYKCSELPNKFIGNQKYIITNELPYSVMGKFTFYGDTIYVDADAISNITNISASFLHAHEVGHKIAKYCDVTGAYHDIANILGINMSDNENMIREVFADGCGNIVANSAYDHGIVRHPLDDETREHIHKRILYHIYTV